MLGQRSPLYALVGALLLGACAAPAAAPARAPGPSTAAAPAAGASQPAAAPAAPEPRATVRIGYTALVPSQSSSWLAKEAGVFERYNIDAQLTYINGGPAGMASMISGELDALVVGASSVVRTAVQGSDTVMIAATKPQLAGAVMARAGIDKPADLRGKRIGVATRATNSELVARVGLQRNGIDPDDGITYLAIGSGGPRIAALREGAVDACGCIPPDNLVAEELGYHTVIDVTALNYRYLANGLAALRQKTQEQPELYRRILQAYAEGAHLFKTDPEFALKVIADYTKLEDLKSLRAGYEFERQLMTADLRIDPESIRTAIEEVAETIPQAANTKPEEFMEPRFQRELAASGFFDRLGR